ncbi:unnamed protein product [Parascedosporium putredinis]|uniref:Kinetochore protein n=1 Tax=Parascedosporium putredinis TaxID=1442378 RepID=A0A9P1HDF5_9PEZI|nr:unnamed protein product [Parascedosporium putredinis]CAI8004768.1 unnamed protein product [Parascedosporium putredinis]
METDSAHRKIELQEPEDLAFLIANVRQAARERIDEAFPQSLVDEYITKTFTLAAPSLAINGLPVDPDTYLSPDKPNQRGSRSKSKAAPAAPVIYEAFDDRMHQRVLDLAREEEDLLAEIAALKQKSLSAVNLVCGDLQRIVAEGSAGLLGVDAAVKAKGGDGGAAEEAWRNAIQGLEKLKREMPAAVAKMERARVAGEYVITEGR